MTLKSVRMVTFVLCVSAVSLLSMPVFAQVSIRVTGVPDDLAFPLAPGANVVLTATVTGGRPGAVYLAWTGDAEVRIMLKPAGVNSWQSNLADKLVSAMLSAGEAEGQFRIFARVDNAPVVASIPIRYTVAQFSPPSLPPRVYVYEGDTRKEVLLGPDLNDLSLLLRVTDSSLWVKPSGFPDSGFAARTSSVTRFVAPAKVTRIEIVFDENVLKAAAEARVGERTWTFRASRDANVLSLSVDPEIRSAWAEHRTLALRCSVAGRERLSVVLTAPPVSLDLPKDGAEMTIIQRQSKELPGSSGFLVLYMDDITHGRTLLTLTSADGRKLLDQVPVRVGGNVTFKLGDEEYRLRAKRLVNYLVGDDYAVFTLSRVLREERAAPTETERIEHLIDLVAKSDVTLIRDGKEYTPAEAADHFRDKYAFARDEVHTLNDFIENVASSSWVSRREYLIKLPDGTQLTAKEWLLDLAAKLEPVPAKP